MTPKQYAEQLYNKYYAIIFEYGEEMSQEIVISQLAKKCAIQAVNEIMESISLVSYNCSEYTFKLLQEQSIFWVEVKQKLEQL